MNLEDLCAAYEQEFEELSAIVSLAAVDEPRPEKLKRIIDGRIEPYMASGFEGPRQALPQPYKLNGAFYLVSLEGIQPRTPLYSKGLHSLRYAGRTQPQSQFDDGLEHDGSDDRRGALDT